MNPNNPFTLWTVGVAQIKPVVKIGNMHEVRTRDGVYVATNDTLTDTMFADISHKKSIGIYYANRK